MTWNASLLASLALLTAACSSGDSGRDGATHDGATIDGSADTRALDGAPPADLAADVSAADRPTSPDDASVDLTTGPPDAPADQSPAPDSEPDRPPPDAAEPDAPAPDAAAADAAPPDVVAMCGPLRCDCTFGRFKLTGKVKYVGALDFPDFTVRVVDTNLPDLYVQEVAFPPDTRKCGQWQVDMFFPDFKVRKVGFAEIADFTIQYDDFFPGLPGMR
jgi:hypothetical protein